MEPEPLNLAVFISGNGSNLQALIDACSRPDFPARVSIVISHKPGAYGLERAEKSGIPAEVVSHTEYPDRQEFEAALQNILDQYPVDLICLAGFMRILTPSFVRKWEGKILNTHPSLLPKFGGKNMYGEHVHRAVLEAGERESGATIFIVTEECDEGPILIQRKVNVDPADTPESLMLKIQAQEHIAYPEAVRIMAEKSVVSA